MPIENRKQYGSTLNEAKRTIEELLANQKNNLKESTREWFDPTIPGIKPKIGHFHLVTQAIRKFRKFSKESDLANTLSGGRMGLVCIRIAKHAKRTSGER